MNRLRNPGPGDVDPLDVVAQPLLQLLGQRGRDLARRLPLRRARAASRRSSSSRRTRAWRPSALEARALADARRRRTVGESGPRPVLVVVRLAGEDLVRPVELLEQHDARELVRQRHRARTRASCRSAPARARAGRRRRSRGRGPPGGAPRAIRRAARRRTPSRRLSSSTTWARSGIRPATLASSRSSTSSSRAWPASSFW